MRFLFTVLPMSILLFAMMDPEKMVLENELESVFVEHTIEIKNMLFSPSELTIKKGDVVVWINKDIVAHDITESRAKKWTSSAISPGDSWKMTINSSFSYYCSIHPMMKGKIAVK